MLAPAFPPDEIERLASLHDLAILDTVREERFDRLTEIASLALDVPIAVVSLVDANRQWFKSCLGLDATETSREVSFCGHAILEARPLIVGDALVDPRFADNPLVTGEPHIRFYAGCPLADANGHLLGTLCVIDRVPRQLTECQIEILTRLARTVESELRGLGAERSLELLRESEARLRATEELTRAVVEGVVDGVVVIDERGRIETFNKSASTMFGIDAGSAIGQNVSILMAEGERDAHAGYIERYLSTGNRNVVGTRRDLTARRNDGELFPISMAVSESWVDGRRIFTGTIRDLTEQRRADTALRRLAEVIDASTDFVGTASPDGVTQFVNPAGRRMVGLDSSSDIAAVSIATFHPPWAQELVIGTGIPTAIRDGVWIGDSALLRADGTEIPVSQSILVHRSATGEVEFMSTVARDVSDRIEVERLRGIHIAMDQFVSTVSHELRTPLTSIRGALGLVVGGALGEVPEMIAGILGVAMANTDRLIPLINDLLDMEKMEAGAIELDLDDVDPNEIIGGALACVESVAWTSGIEIATRSSVPTGWLMRCDRPRMIQVLVNLLANAIKFSSAGSTVEIDVSIGEDGASAFTVIDHGIGIEPSAQGRLFEPFWQADSSDTRSAGGTGLGLAITKAIVEQHAGWIDVRSQVGRGSAFRVVIPAASGEQFDAGSEAADGTAVSAGVALE